MNEALKKVICGECGHHLDYHQERVSCDGAHVKCEVDDCPCELFVAAKPAPLDAEQKQVVADMVNNPTHYGGADDPFEHIKVAEALGWGYHIGNCTKYLWRVGKKDQTKILEDLRKARWYLDRYIQKLEKTP